MSEDPSAPPPPTETLHEAAASSTAYSDDVFVSIKHFEKLKMEVNGVDKMNFPYLVYILAPNFVFGVDTVRANYCVYSPGG